MSNLDTNVAVEKWILSKHIWLDSLKVPGKAMHKIHTVFSSGSLKKKKTPLKKKKKKNWLAVTTAVGAGNTNKIMILTVTLKKQ